MQVQAIVKSLLQMFEGRTDDLDNTLAAVGISLDDNDDDDKSEGLLMYLFFLAKHNRLLFLVTTGNQIQLKLCQVTFCEEVTKSKYIS